MDGQRKVISKYDTMRLPTMFISPEAVALIEVNFFAGDWSKAIQTAAFRSQYERRLSDRLFWGRVTVALTISCNEDMN